MIGPTVLYNKMYLNEKKNTLMHFSCIPVMKFVHSVTNMGTMGNSFFWLHSKSVYNLPKNSRNTSVVNFCPTEKIIFGVLMKKFYK